MDIWLLTIYGKTKDNSLEFKTLPNAQEYVNELVKQIEQNSYNDGFIEIYKDSDYQYISRISEIVGFEVTHVKEKKRWFQ